LTSIEYSEYISRMKEKVEECYSLAEQCRSKGFDVKDIVEIPLAADMAERVEELLSIKGIAQDIRDLSGQMSREEVSLEMSRRVVKRYIQDGREIALEKAVRTGLAILTEGILVAPLEGITGLKILSNRDGSEYVSVTYAGPIRGAGGTAQALSVLIADIVRRDLGISKYIPYDDEVERYIEEIQSYNRVKHLQYLPTPDEIKTVVRNCPVCIDGDGSEQEEVSGHRDMERVSTNRIRGGMCLVICEGIIQKSKKILKHTDKLKIDEWSFLNDIGKTKVDSEDSKSSKFLHDIVAGRPVFSHPGAPGGFRLRYGRSRVSGLAAASIHPASMEIVEEFIATGCQLKVELPGKAAAITPCDTIEGPMILTKTGRHLRLRTREQARELLHDVERITDMGEILFSYGDFLENNRNLEPSSFSVEWWNHIAKKEGLPEELLNPPDVATAFRISREFSIPLHPNFNLFWHDLTSAEILMLREIIKQAKTSGTFPVVEMRNDIFEILVKLGCEFSYSGKNMRIDDNGILIETFALDEDLPETFSEIEDPLKLISMISGVEIKARAPTRIGARMGRPEKAGDRKMKPKVHMLFPLENLGDTRRLLSNAIKNSSGQYEAEFLARKCPACGAESPVPVCPVCGKHTEESITKKGSVDIQILLNSAMKRLSLDEEKLPQVKGVKKLMSRRRVAEPLEKGILRAIHDVSVNKDGTCRYDMTDIPLTHFRMDEIQLPENKGKELGYDEKMNEIFPQDVIIPWDCGEYLLKVSKYVDDLLVKYYGMPAFYNCNDPEDLIGQIVIGLAPHTSGGIAGRIIGFTSAGGCYAHPFFHAAKRRNCDGDEDSVMLLMDGLLNFSREFLPSTTGGLMDAPLVMTMELRYDEVDKEALNLDTLSEYPLEFYNAAEERVSPVKLEELMMPMKNFVQKYGTMRGISFTFDTGNINAGVEESAYKTLGTMEEKIDKQLDLARKIRAVNADDVANRLINSHFLPDMYGNLRGFFTQEFRCTSCNAKYRRVPLNGKCRNCGKDGLVLTVHKGGVVKYMEVTRKISENFNLEPYLRMRIENLFRTIENSFREKEQSTNTLEEYQAVTP